MVHLLDALYLRISFLYISMWGTYLCLLSLDMSIGPYNVLHWLYYILHLERRLSLRRGSFLIWWLYLRYKNLLCLINLVLIYDICWFAYVLVESWKYEHFSSICDICFNGFITVGFPRAKRWKHSHPVNLLEYRQMINAMTLDYVIWTPNVDYGVY